MVTLDDLHLALLWVSGAPDSQAYLDRVTGEIYYTGTYADEKQPIPDDLEDGERYISLPGQRDLDLGQRLVFRFVEETMPQAYDQVRQIFHSRGAYRRFKDLLDRAGMLEQWHRYEEQAVLKALREWCSENGIDVAE